jgi:xanthine dehydrogenase accessory factor
VASLQEARQVFDAVDAATRRGVRSVLVEVVSVEGSAYRRPGALMMMAGDGQMLGTVSGGCLEGDLFVRADALFQGQGEPMVVDYDLAEEDMWSLGIGCKGRITVWMRSAEAAVPERSLLQQGGVLLATLPGGPSRVWVPGQALPGHEAVRERVAKSWAGAEPRLIDGLYVRSWRPPERLVVMGAGHDAEPVARLARQVGFSVTVVDPRPEFNDDRRFPGCQHIVTEAARLDPQAYPELAAGAYWVVMNHHKERDRAGLRAALRMEPRFVGALGPWNRTRELVEGLSAEEQDRINGPVGLDLSADTPDEVAVSIVAELMAVRKGRAGGSLNRKARLHA